MKPSTALLKGMGIIKEDPAVYLDLETKAGCALGMMFVGVFGSWEAARKQFQPFNTSVHREIRNRLGVDGDLLYEIESAHISGCSAEFLVSVLEEKGL